MGSMRKALAVAPLLSAAILSTLALAQSADMSAPMAVIASETIPSPRDVPYPGGTIGLAIDATDVTRGLYKVTETIPVAAGTRELTLMLPKWIPGHHSASGTIEQLVDVRFLVDGKEIAWKRDRVDVFAFHLALPQGTREVVARFVHASPLKIADGRITMTREMLNLQFDRMSLYPAGHYVRKIKVKPVVTFPAGWRVFTALDGQSAQSGKVSWDAVQYDTLVDSPIFAGKYAQRWDLGEGIFLDAVADKAGQLAMPPEGLAAFKAMASEAVLAFGARHFDHYELLVAMTDRLSGVGLEHHRSSENTFEPEALVKWKEFDWSRNVVTHELSHSWDGKFRRPARLWTPDYRQPMENDLLWVYEGQTQFWGTVLAARSGIQSKQTVLDMIASAAGGYATQPGRKWRSLEDTTFEPITGRNGGKSYDSISRNADYYREAMLVWIEVDQIIRNGTGGRKSIDDFARAFFGMRDGDWGELPFEFGDVVSTLNSVYPYDWAKLLDTRINRPGQPAPLMGIEQGGYRLVWKDEPNSYDKARYASDKVQALTYSLGLSIGKDGAVSGVMWDGPAFDAGIVPGAKIVAVNGETYDGDDLAATITAAKSDKDPIVLLVQRGTRFMTVSIDYHDGLKYPWLERIAPGKGVAGLDLLLAPRRIGVVPVKRQ